MNKQNLYGYQLPQNLIAKKPSSPRDSAKLFIYDTAADTITFSQFSKLDKFLPEKSFLVLNNTRVLPARVELKKQTGGKVICLLLMNEIIHKAMPARLADASTKLAGRQDSTIVIKALPDRKINVGEKLYVDQNSSLDVLYQNGKIFYLKLNFNLSDLYRKLDKIGKTPIPLYLRKTSLTEKELRQKYQTVFAKEKGSVAAPTASLHFTPTVFNRLAKKGIQKHFVTLHVGMGTFAPIDEKNIKRKKLHQEYFQVDVNSYQEFKSQKALGLKLIAAGTTTVRTLESAATRGLEGSTDLFIMPPYKFKMVDVLITNFHLPESSLMMLVEAFLQHKKSKKHLVELYNTAIKNKFRFFSFGDAMLIL